MSEYMKAQPKGDAVSADETLFDDTLLNEMTRTVGSQDQAYLMLGIIPPRFERQVEPTRGAAVELGARALAVNNVMDTYNHLNKTMGARIVSERSDSDFNQRNSNPSKVIEGMGRKAAGMIHANKDDFDTLNASADMLNAGFSAQVVDRQKRQLTTDMLNAYGPGKAYAADREKVVNKLSRTAKRTSRSR
jgi:hypothetical protein